MGKYRIEVTGSKDMDYEIEAEDSQTAMSVAEEMFEKEFDDIMWSGIDAWDYEELKDES